MKPLPQIMYGTAWKEERTADLVLNALTAGFRAIDTANQRKHYYEEAVGNGIANFLKMSGALRSDLFIQTKFTFSRGQDHRKPYNDTDRFFKQVADSFASSLAHLQTDHIDSYVLHGPYAGRGITNEDLEAWAAMETLISEKKVSHLGISNVTSEQLAELCSKVKIKPRFVQNRCYARFDWDKDVRDVCADHDILYQGFSLLTANVEELSSESVYKICRKYRKTVPQVVFRFCRQMNMIVLTGTTHSGHMSEDLNIEDFKLSDEDVSVLANLSSS